MHIKTPVSAHERGIALLITLLVMGVLLAISAFLLDVTLRQFQLSNIGRDSEIAFQAAEAGIECEMYTDATNANAPKTFDVPENNADQTDASTMKCFSGGGQSTITNTATHSGGAQTFRYEWGTPVVCTDISVYQFYSTSNNVPVIVDSVQVGNDCPQGFRCTVVKSRGYNTGCSNISNAKVIEREITQRY